MPLLLESDYHDRMAVRMVVIALELAKILNLI
jgi:hypothetical protein